MKKVFLKESVSQSFVLMLVILVSGLGAFSCSSSSGRGIAVQKPVELSDTIRILAIGNSFSQDAIEQYLYELAEAEGLPVIIGNLYIAGCPLEKHLSNARDNSPSYQYRKIVNGVKTNTPKTSLLEGLTDEKWNYISMQQASGFSGEYETYAASLPELVQYVKENKTNKNAVLMLHQTWAYASTSTHKAFPKYDKDQMKMYQAIISAASKAADLVGIDIIIPSGTAIQNGRTSYLGDTFTRDGYHLETTYGRYTAACTWFEKIFGKNVIGNTYYPVSMDKSKAAIAQHAAHAAVIKPNEVTVLEEYKVKKKESETPSLKEVALVVE